MQQIGNCENNRRAARFTDVRDGNTVCTGGSENTLVWRTLVLFEIPAGCSATFVGWKSFETSFCARLAFWLLGLVKLSAHNALEYCLECTVSFIFDCGHCVQHEVSRIGSVKNFLVHTKIWSCYVLRTAHNRSIVCNVMLWNVLCCYYYFSGVPLQNANIAAGMKGFLFRPLGVTSVPVEFSNSMRVASWLMCSVTFLILPYLLNSKHRPVSPTMWKEKGHPDLKMLTP